MAKGDKTNNGVQDDWKLKESEIAYVPHADLVDAKPMAVCAYCGDAIEKVNAGVMQWTPCTCLGALQHYVWTLEPEYLDRCIRKLDADVRNGANQSVVGMLPVPLVHRKVLLKFMEGTVYEKRIAPRL